MGEGLAWFIDLANEALPSVAVPDLSNFHGRRLVKLFSQALEEAAGEVGNRPMIQALAEQTPGFRSGAKVNAYRTAQDVRKTLLEVAASAARQDGRPVPVQLVSSTLDSLLIGRDGLIRVKPAVPYGALYKDFCEALEGVDASRIRECSRCHKIFWAHRKDKRACSDGCRVRQWIEDNSDRWEKIQSNHEAKRAEGERTRKRVAR